MFENDIIFGNLIDEDVEFLPMVSIEEDDDDGVGGKKPTLVPILPLRNTVLFPGVVIPITIGRDKSLRAVKKAFKTNKYIGVFAQNDHNVEEPDGADLNKIGTLARVVKILRMPDDNTTVIIQGKSKIRAEAFLTQEPIISAEISHIEQSAVPKNKEFVAMVSSMRDQANDIIKLSPNIPSEARIVLKNIDNPVFLTNFISSNLNIPLKEKQQILETVDLNERARRVIEHLNEEIQLLELKNKIQNKVQGDIEKQQRDYFLTQQMKTIQEELGGDSPMKEINALVEKSKEKKWSKAVQEAFDKEINKIKRMNPAVAEYSVTLNYLELLLDLPWQDYTEDNFDLKKSQSILNADHYGLEKVKERILEYLAVLKLKGDMKSPILCLVGPPGVGKTSLGRSIASALNRKYIRMSLGGLHDESEIRGHRKTYIGAMPGRIVQSLKKAKSSNPVFILDEIDKVGSSHRGDPSSALLEVLDPEQNTTFYDNYLELEYDLSRVMFIATANSLSTIQPALLDRMEVIEISGYSQEEKVQIAKKHLVPKQIENHGLKKSQVKIGNKSIEKVIQNYTRESGVRNLDRVLAKVLRSVAKKVAMEEKYDKDIKPDHLDTILGKIKYDRDLYLAKSPAGVATGLAWTSVGGDILFIECGLNKGKGNLNLTGNLGKVMKESAMTALSYIKSNHEELGIDPKDLQANNFHIHVPEGAIPKDGPSAGVTMLSAMVSKLTGRRVKNRLAMTGEITLRGKVLPVGGIKEKVLAAKRAGIKEIVLCVQNKKDIEEINQRFIKGLKFHFVSEMNEVLDIVLLKR